MYDRMSRGGGGRGGCLGFKGIGGLIKRYFNITRFLLVIMREFACLLSGSSSTHLVICSIHEHPPPLITSQIQHFISRINERNFSASKYFVNSSLFIYMKDI